jgi:diacylglycerol kinase (ATP)
MKRIADRLREGQFQPPEIHVRVTLIHNPAAGANDEPSGDELLRLIRQAGHVVSYQSSKQKNWHSALKEPGDIVAVAGGDGTVGKVARRLIDRSIPIAILPIGTANNIATSLGLVSQPIEQLIGGLAGAARFNFDVGVASGPWGSTSFIESLGVGLFTETMFALKKGNDTSLGQSNNAKEELTSVRELLRQRLQTFRPKNLKIRLDGHEVSGDLILLEAMNISYVGPNLYLAPDANSGDGLLNVVLLLQGEREKLTQYLAVSQEGKGISPGLNVLRGRHLQIEWEGFPIHIDDEPWPENEAVFPSSNVIDVKIRPHALVFLAPA